MAEQYTVVTAHLVNVHVTSTVSSFASERRFQKDLTIIGLKGKLEVLTGGSAPHMQLEVYNKDDKIVCKLENDEAMLGSYPIEDGMRIHVIDKSGTLGEFEDVSKVEKYEISEGDYANRTDSVRAFKQRMKMGQFAEVDPEEKARREAEKKKKEDDEKALAESIKAGNRCEVAVQGQMPRRGTVMYSGLTDFKPGYWIGIKYDEPVGKNDGSVQGRKYFECQPKYGGFVKPNLVKVGDFPEEDLFDDEDLMEM